MVTLLKVLLAGSFVAILALAWCVLSIRGTVREQSLQMSELQTRLADQSKKQSRAAQRECASSAQTFLRSRGLKVDDTSQYENHFNERLNKCFVIISGSIPNDAFQSIDLYDAVEGRRYATYNGHSYCQGMIGSRPRCALDSGSLWFDGDESRMPPDFTVGFRGTLYGGGTGDENTQKEFLKRVHEFMNQ